MEISKLFDNILDLPGIEGVCLFGFEGRIYVNRMPVFISPEVFSDAQRRITAMYETMDENFLPCDDYVLRYAERWLLLRRTDQLVLLILAGDKANMASTRMVTNMTMKHLTPETLAQLPVINDRPAPAPAPGAAPVTVEATAEKSSDAGLATAAAAQPAPEVPPPSRPIRFFRGRPY
ncbi:MAG: hypothetical protein ABII82_05155 [Verrucomicrobiota bacterium]